MTRDRLLAYAQLLRLPNVFTAFADIALAGCVTGAVTARPLAFALMLLASGCLYLSGMAWNDVFDRHADAKTRPGRPIPSGRISPRVAAIVAGVLMLIGLVLAGFALSFQLPQMLAPLALAGLILLYDGVFKHYWIGPIAMGGCRFLNVLAGCLILPMPEGQEVLPFLVAGVIGVYIVGVTWFARTEEGDSARRPLVLATVVMGLAVALGVAVPVWLEPGRVPFFYVYLLAGFAVFVGFALVAAIRQPTPANVQAAVKRCILGLVLLDAVLASAFAWPGLAIALLGLPALWLGKKVYST